MVGCSYDGNLYIFYSISRHSHIWIKEDYEVKNKTHSVKSIDNLTVIHLYFISLVNHTTEFKQWFSFYNNPQITQDT